MVGSSADAGGQLLRELEALSQALYKAKSGRDPDSTRPLTTYHSQGFDNPSSIDLLGLDHSSHQQQQQQQQQQQIVPKKKKSGSLWDWKPLRALAHIGQTKFECEFVAHVHGITRLPSPLEGLRLQVRLKHKETESRTVPSLVFKGCADFEETLRVRCVVYGSVTSGGGVKFMSKTFTLSVVAPDASELELGKHRLDLSRILPEGGGAARSSSSWNTSFKLAGRAWGGVLGITFGYELGRSAVAVAAEAEEEEDGREKAKFFYPKSPDVRGGGVTSFNSLPNSPQAVVAARKLQQEFSIDVEHLNLDEDEEATMTLSSSSGLLAPETPGRQQEQELKGFSVEQSDEVREEEDEEEEVDDFSVIEKGMEEARKVVVCEDEQLHAKREVHPEVEVEVEVEDEIMRSAGGELDEEAEMFLHMLGPSSDSEEAETASDYSPRGVLLKQFEMEQHTNLMMQTVMVSPPEEDDGLSAFLDVAELELQKATQAMKSKARAKMLEDAEAEALMQEWGLNEKAFQNSPSPRAGSGVPSLSNALVLLQDPPCLADGLGSMIPTRDGGSLRSMNPIHFQGGRNDGRLVLQVSKPVVVPAEMGSGVLDIFQSLAAGGAENMAFQVMEAMPLEDITGKNIYQIAMEGQASLDVKNRNRYALGAGDSGNRYALEYGAGAAGGELVPGSSGSFGPLYDQRQRRTYPKRASADDTFVSLEELAPVAMEKIEALAMQGLKIQSDMSEEEAPYSLDSFTSSANLLEGGEYSSSMHLLEGGSAASGDDAGGLMAMSISLDEWMRLDSGLYDETESSGKTKSVLAAHHAAHSSDIVLLANEDGGARRRDDPQAAAGNSAASGGGLMGDTLTLAMLVQLRDPLRNYEPVGAPMMAFVQAERVMVPPRPKMYKRVSLQGNSEQDDEEPKASEFKITGVHMAGLKPNDSSSGGDKKKIWGTQKQQQSGSRWLLAHGMGKTGGAKHPLLKSKSTAAPAPAAPAAAPVATSSANNSKNNSSSSSKQGGESLWSISAKMGANKSTKAAASSITRNPDVKFGSRLSLGKKKW